MNGLSEASIICGGNIGDPGFYLYVANVKQKLQKILRTDREELLIEKVERWNSVRVTFKLPQSSAHILRSLAEQRSESLRNLGIHSVQVDAGRLLSLATASSQLSDNRNASGNIPNASRCSPTEASNSSSIAGRRDGDSSSSLQTSININDGNGANDAQKKDTSKRLDIRQNEQCDMTSDGPSSKPSRQPNQQQNILGYLLDEPDQPAMHQQPPPYQDYHQRRQTGSFAPPASTPEHTHQEQRWQQHQGSNLWDKSAPQFRSSPVAATGPSVPDYYYARPHHSLQQSYPTSTPLQQQRQCMGITNVSVMHSGHQQETTSSTVVASYPPTIENNGPVYQNFNQHQQSHQHNSGTVSNSPLLVGLLQQNSPPPSQPSASSSFMQPSATPLFRNNIAVNLSDYNNETNIGDTSPSSWAVNSNQHPTSSVSKKHKKGPTTKPKKAPNSNPKNYPTKKPISKRAGSSNLDGTSSIEPLVSGQPISSLSNADQDVASQQQHAVAGSMTTSSFNRDTSISSVIDSVLCSVKMKTSTNVFDAIPTTNVTMEPNVRESTDSPTSQIKSASSTASIMAGSTDETGSHCCSTPTSSAVLSHQQRQVIATELPVQYSQSIHQQQQVLRSVSSSSSCSSPLIASASPTTDMQWQQQQRVGTGITCPGGSGVTSYGVYQNHPNHQFIRHHPYHQYQESEEKIRRQLPIPRQGIQLAQTSSSMTRFPITPGTPTLPRPYASSQTTFDLAHENTSRSDGNMYHNALVKSNSIETRNPAIPIVNGDIYLSSSTRLTVPISQQMCHGQQIPQLHEQYGASGPWASGECLDDNGAVRSVLATTADMISSKAMAAIASPALDMANRGPDHDYLVMSSPVESSYNNQFQRTGANAVYGFASATSQQRGDSNYGKAIEVSTTAMFYNGGGEEQRMQEALVAQHSSAYNQPQWDKQQQRIVDPRQWPMHSAHQPIYEQYGSHRVGYVNHDESLTRDIPGSVGSSPDSFPSTNHQRQVLGASTPAQHHKHGQQQQSVVDDPMLSGQVPAR